MSNLKLKLSNSDLLANRARKVDEKKFHLRKIIYELDRLSYERGTRKGDYILREQIRDINNELELYDGKIRTCDIITLINLFTIKETILFFEDRYLDSFSINVLLESLKQELINQQNADIEHNKRNTNEKFERSLKNSYRAELEKDLLLFEGSVNNKLIPNISAFLLDINELYFIQSVVSLTKNNKKYNERETGNEIAKLKDEIYLFIRIYLKINKKYLTKDNIFELVSSVLDTAGCKDGLIRFCNFNEAELAGVISASTAEFTVQTEKSDSISVMNETVSPEKKEEYQLKSSLEKILKDLRYLRDFAAAETASDESPEDVYHNKSKKFLYHSPDKASISLKDIADYLMNSMIFVNEWLYIELKKNPDLFNMFKLLLQCIPLEIRFFELYKSANLECKRADNQKINIWGELKQFIPTDMARGLKENIGRLSDELNDAFKRTVVDIEMEKDKNSVVLNKKINIIYESFYNSYRKIMKELKKF